MVIFKWQESGLIFFYDSILFSLKFDLFTLEQANKKLNSGILFYIRNNFLTKFKSIMGNSHDIAFMPASLIWLENFKLLENTF